MKTIEAVIKGVYGVDESQADALVVEWAATKFSEIVGLEKAAKAWKRLNTKRQHAGRHTSIPQWGTPMFEAYFA